MPNNSRPHKPVLFLLGGAFLVAGLLAWIWTGDWRFGATGGILLLLAVIVAAATLDGDR